MWQVMQGIGVSTSRASGVEVGVIWLREGRNREEARSRVSVFRRIGYRQLGTQVVETANSEGVIERSPDSGGRKSTWLIHRVSGIREPRSH
jgi:hypothetical protein